MKRRLDQELVRRRLMNSRSQAENHIRLGQVTVNKKAITKPGFMIGQGDSIQLTNAERYVSRAALKLASVSGSLGLDFRNSIVLDVGSSTGGFTDYSLQHGARKVIAVDVGTNQLHPSLRDDKRIELHEKTDIRSIEELSCTPDIVVIDVSFISLREILPHLAKLVSSSSVIVAMVKPQFEAGRHQVNKGVIKNDTVRRRILQDFEIWVKKLFFIQGKADSDIKGSKGNKERFYLLKKIKQ